MFRKIAVLTMLSVFLYGIENKDYRTYIKEDKNGMISFQGTILDKVEYSDRIEFFLENKSFGKIKIRLNEDYTKYELKNNSYIVGVCQNKNYNIYEKCHLFVVEDR